MSSNLSVYYAIDDYDLRNSNENIEHQEHLGETFMVLYFCLITKT